ncbi:MAG: NAD(P)/FAD-dependent oxidoreductase [Chitinophagales bacterium]
MNKHYEVIIIGSGFGGLAAGIQLKEKGITDFLLLERDAEMGGTWWANSYPGAQVDVESILYSFSFEPYDWSRVFAYQHELLKYTNHIIDKYDLRSKTECNKEVTRLAFDEANAVWQVDTKDGQSYTATFIINASGGLSQPNIPDFKNLDQFKGKTMHSARWDHSYDYKDKKVAVVGSAASAIQIIPTIAPYVKELTIFQRNAHWILPRPDRALTNVERNTFKRFPQIQKAYRRAVYMKLEGRVLAFQYMNNILKLFQKEGEDHIKSAIKDKDLQKKVLPDYLMGCKRILLSSDYYPSLNRPNVRLLTRESGIKEFTPTGIATIDGQQIDVDLVVFATGFHASEDVVVYPVIGRNGVTLDDAWQHHAHAYLGTTVPNFPNFFLLAGPNTGTGHTSAIGMLEAQMEYILRAIQYKQKKNCKTIEVKSEIEAKYNEVLQKELAKSVWQTGGCSSWYQTKDGINTTMYPRFTFLFKRDCQNFEPKEHIVTF